MEVSNIEIKLEAYRQCFESKHHYDTFSWTIAAVVVVLVAALLAIIPKITVTPLYLTLPLKLLVAAFGWTLLFLWWKIYERNRFWAEVCNEQARDIEKEMKLNGLGHSFMKAALSKSVLLKNTDVNGQPYQGALPKLESCNADSVHKSIRIVIAILVIVLLFSAFIGYEI